MRAHVLPASLGLSAAVWLCGCGSAEPERPAISPTLQAFVRKVEKQAAVQLTAPIKTSAAELLGRPREELARRCEELAGRISYMEQKDGQGQIRATLAPGTQFNTALPVWQSARYDPGLGFSVPPYLPPGGKDAALALHLARYGDAEAALKLVPEGDGGTRQQVEALRLKRNYPVEWTRLMALLVRNAELNLAQGKESEARTVIALHRQIAEVLDPGAAAGPLGRALLPLGRALLARAEAYWAADGKTALRDEAAGVLAAWPEPAAEPLPLRRGDPPGQAAALVGGAAVGHALRAPDPQRALDLLGLPFPLRRLQDVVCLFDAGGGLDEVLLVYDNGVAREWLQPDLWRGLLEAAPAPAGGGPPPLLTFRYSLPGSVCEVEWVRHNEAVGGCVRLRPDGAGVPVTVPRDFGPVHLSRSFEQNRRQFARHAAGSVIDVSDPSALGRLTLPFPELPLHSAALARDGTHNAVGGFTVRVDRPDKKTPALADVALPAWCALGAHGPASVHGTGPGGELRLAWGDGRTAATLRVPDSRLLPAELVLADAPGAAGADRERQALAWDGRERQARLAAMGPLASLPRELHRVSLGQPREDVLGLFAGLAQTVERRWDGGVALTFTGPARPAAYQLRELVVRFDGAAQAGEVRARYVTVQGGQGGVGARIGELTGELGVPEPRGPWRRVAGGDGPAADAGLPYAEVWRWCDDLTVLEARQGPQALELVLRPRRGDGGEPDAGTPLALLPRGPDGCEVGAAREDLLRRWRVDGSRTAAGALVLPPPATSAYDALLVWFEGGKAVRVVARHRPLAAAAAPPEKALLDAWSQDMRAFGWPVRQDFTDQKVLQACAACDDAVRVRMFWQDADGRGPAVFTEWAALADR